MVQQLHVKTKNVSDQSQLISRTPSRKPYAFVLPHRLQPRETADFIPSTFQTRHKQTPATAHELDASHGIYPEEKTNSIKTRRHESPCSSKLHLNHRIVGAIFISVETDTF